MLVMLGAGLAVLLGGLLLASRSGLVVNRFKPQLEAELSKALNREVTVARVEGGIFDRVILRHVRISSRRRNPDSVDITIDRVVVQYSLWDILVRKKPLAESLHRIDFIQPLLEWERRPDGQSWRGPDFSDIPLLAGSGGGPIPAVRLALTAGELRFRDRRETARLTNLRGLFNLKDPAGARLYLSGRIGKRRLQNVRVSGVMDLTAGYYRLSCEGKRIELQPLSLLLGSDQLRIEDGRADMQLRLTSRPKGEPAGLIPGVAVSGKLVLHDCAMLTPLAQEPIKNIYGVVRLQDQRLSLANLQASFGKTNWSAKGAIENLRKPALNVRVQSEHLQLAHLVESIPRFKQVKADGFGKAAFLIRGPATDPVVTATFDMAQARLGRLEIKKFEVISKYHAGELRLLLAKGQFARGSVDGKGRLLLPEKGPAQIQFEAEADQIALEDAGPLLGVQDLRGTVSAALLLQGDLAHPRVAGKIRSSLISAAGMKFQQVQAGLEWTDRSLAVDLQADWDLLQPALIKLRANKAGETWSLSPFTITAAGQELLRAQGAWGPKDALNVRVQARGLPVRVIPGLPAALHHLNGHVNFAGRLGGTTKEPRFEGSFDTPALLTTAGRRVDGQGAFLIAKQAMTLSHLWLDNQRIQAQGNLQTGGAGLMSGKVILKSVPCQTVAMLSGLSKDFPQGRLDGRMVFSGTMKKPVADAEIEVSDFRWSGLAAERGRMALTSDGRQLSLKTLELKQAAGRLTGEFTLDLAGGQETLKLTAAMDQFRVAGRTCTGHLTMNGGREDGEALQGLLLIDQLEIDRRALPKLAGQFRRHKDQLQIEDLQWGPEFSLAGKVRLDAKQPAGQLHIALKDNGLEAFRWLLAAKPGLADKFTGTADLTLENRQARLNANLAAGARSLNSELVVDFTPAFKVAGMSGTVTAKDMRMPVLMEAMLQDPAHGPQGAVTGTVVFQSGARMEKMSGQLEFSNFRFGEWRFKALKTVWEMDQQDVRILSLEGLQPTGSLRGSNGRLRFQPEGKHALNLDLVADNFLFFTKHFHGHFAAQGTLNFKPFDLQLGVASQDFSLNLYPFGDFRANLHYRGEQLSIRSQPGYPVEILGELVVPPDGAVIFEKLSIAEGKHEYVSMKGQLTPDRKSELRVNVRNVKADIIARSMGWPQAWTGYASGAFRYWEESSQDIFFQIHVKVENGSVAGLKFNSLVGIVNLDHDWLYFRGPEHAPEAAILTADHYTMFLKGRLPLPQTPAAAERMKGAEMDMQLSMPEGDFSYITFVPYFSAASGPASLDLAIRGTMDYPSLSGRASVKQGRLSPRLYTPLVEQLEGEVRFDDNRMYIETLQGKVGEGRLRVTAGPAGAWASVFRRLQPEQLNLRLESVDGRIRLNNTPEYEFVSAWATVRAGLAGTLENPVVSGSIELGDGNFTYPGKPLSDFTRSLKGGTLAYDHFRLTTRKNLWFYNDVLRAEIAPEQSVAFHGGKYDLAGEGRIRIAKGSFTYLENDFHLDPNEETAINFQGREKPMLSGLATSTIRAVEIKNEGRRRDAVIRMRIQGALGEIKITLDSDPKLTQAQILSLLTLGEDYSSWSQAEVDQQFQAAGARVLGRLAGNLISKEVEKSIKRITPLDVIDIRLGGLERVADNIMSGGNTASASSARSGISLLQDTQIDVGKYLTEDLFLNYRGTLKDRGIDKGGLSWESYLGLEYNINPTRKLKAYKNFDKDSDEEMFVGIEGRMQFKGWSPAEFDREIHETRPKKTPTPAQK